jgi:hypothetical protein
LAKAVKVNFSPFRERSDRWPWLGRVKAKTSAERSYSFVVSSASKPLSLVVTSSMEAGMVMRGKVPFLS